MARHIDNFGWLVGWFYAILTLASLSDAEVILKHGI